MILRYCDACGQQIQKSYAIDRLTGEMYRRNPEGRRVKVQFEVMVGVADAINAGDVCRDCVIDAVNSMDTRPTMAIAE